MPVLTAGPSSEESVNRLCAGSGWIRVHGSGGAKSGLRGERVEVAGRACVRADFTHPLTSPWPPTRLPPIWPAMHSDAKVSLVIARRLRLRTVPLYEASNSSSVSACTETRVVGIRITRLLEPLYMRVRKHVKPACQNPGTHCGSLFGYCT